MTAVYTGSLTHRRWRVLLLRVLALQKALLLEVAVASTPLLGFCKQCCQRTGSGAISTAVGRAGSGPRDIKVPGPAADLVVAFPGIQGRLQAEGVVGAGQPHPGLDPDPPVFTLLGLGPPHLGDGAERIVGGDVQLEFGSAAQLQA